MNRSIYIHYGTDICEMTYALMEQADVAPHIKPGGKVVLKPNLLIARPASEGATTHPEIAEGIIRYLQDHGFRDITIAEGAWAGADTPPAFSRCGYSDLAKRYGVRLVDTKRDAAVALETDGLRIAVCKTPLEADYLINIPVLKSHCQTGLTCCLKNMKGCIPDSEKRRFHSLGLHRPIALLGTVLRPDLHVVDSICGDLTFEEGGNPVEQNRILLGSDPVLLDSYAAQLIGYSPEEIEHVRLAAQYGVGTLYGEGVTIKEAGAESRPRTRAQHSRIARQLAAYIEEDSACSTCYAALIFALNKLGAPSLRGQKVKIGQGFRGKQPDGVGVGNCTKGCKHNIPGCPPKAVDIYKFLTIL